MIKDSEAEKALNAVCAEGKELSIGVKITDTKKAIQLMSTMYPKEDKPNPFGVEVYSWGSFDVTKALELKIKAMEEEVTRHNTVMSNISCRNLRSFID